MGLTACFLLVLYVQQELSFDDDFEDREQIYQVNLFASFGGEAFTTSNTSPPVGTTLQAEFPEIESFTRHYMPGDVVLQNEAEAFTESNLWLVDSNFLSFFSFPLLEGEATTCLEGTNALVLTETIAKKYFGDAPAIGKSLELEKELFTVTGILADLPRNSSLQFDMLAPIASSKNVERFSWSWIWLQVDTYVRLNAPMNTTQVASLEQKFPAMVHQHAASAFDRIGQNLDDFFAEGNRWELSLLPLSDVHLYSPDVSSRLGTKSDIEEVYIFSTIGFFILLLACINFMNLTTARSLARAKEVGVRKLLGSSRAILVRQFLSEAMLYALVSGILGVVLVYFLLPSFNSVMNQTIVFSDLSKTWGLIALAVLPLSAGLLAGIYPSIYLSHFQPLSVLKSRMSTAKGGSTWIRNGLVVFQFAISIALVICTLVVLEQINYSINGDLGMDKDNLLVIPNAESLSTKSEAFKQELLKFSEVKAVSISTDLPGDGNVFADFYIPESEANKTELEDVTLYSYMVDDDFLPTMNIQLAAGRNFDENRSLDSTAIIINEAAARLLGWQNPIGKQFTYPGDRNRQYEVVGVMKNFHQRSSRYGIEPFALFHDSSDSYDLGRSSLAVKLTSGMAAETLDKIETLWSQFAPATPFRYTFMDDNLQAQYRSEERLASMLSSFTLVSILLACLGLLGLITYITRQRTKEIGIRKVLGASTSNILTLLSKDFMQLILLALVIASPIAYYFMEQWLQDFAYRIDMQWWTFLVAGLCAIGIALFTVSFQSIRAAVANPVESLRSE